MFKAYCFKATYLSVTTDSDRQACKLNLVPNHTFLKPEVYQFQLLNNMVTSILNPALGRL